MSKIQEAFKPWHYEAFQDISRRSRADQGAFWAGLPREQGDDLRRAEHGFTRSHRGSGRFLGWLVIAALLAAMVAGFYYGCTRPEATLEFIPAQQPAATDPPDTPDVPSWHEPTVARLQI